MVIEAKRGGGFTDAHRNQLLWYAQVLARHHNRVPELLMLVLFPPTAAGEYGPQLLSSIELAAWDAKHNKYTPCLPMNVNTFKVCEVLADHYLTREMATLSEFVGRAATDARTGLAEDDASAKHVSGEVNLCETLCRVANANKMDHLGPQADEFEIIAEKAVANGAIKGRIDAIVLGPEH